MYLLMPFLFAAHDSGFSSMLWLFIIEFLFVLTLYFLIDSPKYGGRIKILIYSSAVLVVTTLGLYFFKEKVLFLGMLLIKLATRSF